MRPCTFQASVMCCPSPDSATVLPRRKTQEGARALFLRSKCDTARVQFGRKPHERAGGCFPYASPNGTCRFGTRWEARAQGMKFTKNTLATLALPAGKVDHIEWDGELPGFGVRLRGNA